MPHTKTRSLIRRKTTTCDGEAHFLHGGSDAWMHGRDCLYASEASTPPCLQRLHAPKPRGTDWPNLVV